ncbi:hypothetical protein DMH01_22070 [Amycolatopsis sp. WAC 04182]|uniref:hypothetical protein n=1 Tax=Amycolatopsis sp. WAC 04182 TaxID=2203198 RepID=UPI000F7AFF67|nr:hypothetical protein [Amycolatopsis sp. WAC 04182]RSN58719.1 hypothetical protein DMH01_22070 [Amycolatopsis sp. WAC 04182]
MTETLENGEIPVPAPEPDSQAAVTGNTVMENSGTVNNTFNNFGPQPQEADRTDAPEVTTSLVDGPVPDAMVKEAIKAFCHPGGYQNALRVLRDRRVLVLCGRSTGRTLAGVRMLIDLNLDALQQLDPLRPLNDLATLRKPTVPTGYLWDDITTKDWADGLTWRTLFSLERFLRESGSFLVIAFGAEDVRDPNVKAYLAEIVAPDTADVAKAHLKARGIPEIQHAGLLGQVELDRALPDYSRPSRGAEVARQLHEAAQGHYDIEEVKENLYRRQDEDVKSWFEKNKDLQIRALAISIAFFEDCPYNTIAAASKELEEVLKNPENREIWPYRPPNLFWESRGDRLRRAQAKPRPADELMPVDPEPIIFSRPDWGERLLLYVWKEHERIRPIIQDWLAGVSRSILIPGATGHDQSMTRFGTLLAKAAERQVMDWVINWAYDGSESLQSLAAMTLRGMSANSSYVRVIKNFLHAWCNPRTQLSCRMTAAIALGGEFGRSQPEFALLRLRRLTKNATPELGIEIGKTISSLLAEPNNRSLVLSTLPVWILEGGATSRQIALRCALTALSLNGRTISFAEGDTAAVRILITALLEDGKLRRKALSGLTLWAVEAEWKAESNSHIAGLLRLLFTSPDDILIRRLSFYLRKAFAEDPRQTAPLRNALARSLKEISDAR